MITFTAWGTPRPKGSKKHYRDKSGQVRIVEAHPATRHWETAVAGAAVEAAREHRALEGPVAVDLTFYVPTPKSAPKRRWVYPIRWPDADKLARCVCDAMTGVIYRDDAQVTTLTARKIYAGRQDDHGRVPAPRVEVRVQPDHTVPGTRRVAALDPASLDDLIARGVQDPDAQPLPL